MIKKKKDEKNNLNWLYNTRAHGHAVEVHSPIKLIHIDAMQCWAIRTNGQKEPMQQTTAAAAVKESMRR